MVMKKAGVAELKAHLSEYLRAARSGQEIVICDRDTPVARLVPPKRPSGVLTIRKPRPGAPPLSASRLPEKYAKEFRGIDVVELLMEDRRKR